MPRAYTVAHNLTNTASPSNPMLIISSTASNLRPRLYDLTSGSDAVNDAAVKYTIQRQTSTTAPVGFTTITPNPIDSGDPAATCTASGGAFTTNPSVSAGVLLQWGQNQRATFRWVAAPGKEILSAPGANVGLALMSLVSTAAFNGVWSLEYDE